MSECSELRAGDWVEVRNREEILLTLDERGEVGALPFMPEMFQYCGKRFRVFKRAHKTCDPPSGLQARRMANSVHLEAVRCDGEAHGGCQAGCLIFWKEVWLKKVGEDGPVPPRFDLAESGTIPIGVTRCTEEDVRRGVLSNGGLVEPAEPVYVCQSTRLHAATTPLVWWDIRQYAEDLRSGNVKPLQMGAALVFFVYHKLAESGLGFSSAMRWTYDKLSWAWGGAPYPLRNGRIPRGMRTPSDKLDLQAGELVRVRSYAEILETLDEAWNNRGMYFDVEQVPFCNGTYPVLRRVEKIIDERTGKMMRLRSDAIILKGVFCQARYSKCRRLCPRSIYSYWREVWLERVG
jgi:hypothetical protein